MQHYFDSLERVIDLKPKVLIPSHGMPMGGTLLAERTLQHRIEREQQIRDYLDRGMDDSQITEEIYREIHPRLKSLALQNVKQHIKKLQATKH